MFRLTSVGVDEDAATVTFEITGHDLEIEKTLEAPGQYRKFLTVRDFPRSDLEEMFLALRTVLE